MNEANGQRHARPGTLPPPGALRQAGWTLDLPVEGRSMEPLLRERDNATVVCGAIETLQPGDLICFQRDNAFVLHRLIERRNEGRWFEKGDAETGGSWIDPDTVMGRVTRVNGAPIHDVRRKEALIISRAEHGVAGFLKRLGCPRIPARWSAAWRWLKTRYLQRAAGA